MNDSKRKRRNFRPEVGSLEGRLVPSGGVAATAAGAAHLQQLQEQRHPLQEQRVEHRQEVRLQREEAQATRMMHSQANRASREASRLASATGSVPVVVGRPSARRVHLPRHPRRRRPPQAPATVGSVVSMGMPLTVIPGERAVPNSAISGMASIGAVMVSSSTSVSPRTTGSNAGFTNSTMGTTTMGTTTMGTTTTTGIAFTNIPTTPGTSFTTGGDTTTGTPGVTFTNIPTTPGTSITTGGDTTTGIPGVIFTNIPTPSTTANAFNTTSMSGMTSMGMNTVVITPTGMITTSMPMNFTTFVTA